MKIRNKEELISVHEKLKTYAYASSPKKTAQLLQPFWTSWPRSRLFWSQNISLSETGFSFDFLKFLFLKAQ